MFIKFHMIYRRLDPLTPSVGPRLKTVQWRDPTCSFLHSQDSPVGHFPIQLPGQLQSVLCPYHITETVLPNVASNLFMVITPPLIFFFCHGFHLFFHVITCISLQTAWNHFWNKILINKYFYLCHISQIIVNTSLSPGL